MRLKSKAFRYGEAIPKHFAMEGDDVSLPLEWDGEPDGTASFALIADDRDVSGGVQSHWVMYNIPADCHSLAEEMEDTVDLSEGARNGVNGWYHVGYDGPEEARMPHRYHIRLFALDTRLSLPSETTRNRLKKAMRHHIVAEADLMGVYPE